MSDREILIDDELDAGHISDELQREIRLFRKLRPLIGYCLSLNHDINNPLAGILGYADFIQSDSEALSSAQREDLQQIIECAERIKALVGKVGIIKASLATDSEVQDMIADYRRAVESL